MIFDRTQNDVDTAKVIRAEYVQQGKVLTVEQREQLERGTITVNTLNRIESKQQELKGLFNSMGYWNTTMTHNEWTCADIFNEKDFQRLIDNLNKLMGAFFVYIDTPNTPPMTYHYESINSLEKILFDLDLMINEVKSRYKRCNTFRCEEVIDDV